MSDDGLMREKARKLIGTGKLPNRAPDHIWGGPGTGAECAVCGEAMKHGEVELEIEFARDGTHSGDSYLVHLRCFSVLEDERQRKAVSAKHNGHPVATPGEHPGGA